MPSDRLPLSPCCKAPIVALFIVEGPLIGQCEKCGGLIADRKKWEESCDSKAQGGDAR